MPRTTPMPAGSLTCFGVGEGWPCADRKHSSFLFRFGDIHLLFDTGDGLSSTFKASGLSYDSIDRVFISHLHSDHVGGFSLFVQGLWLEKRRRPLPVHAPGQGIPAIQAWLEATILFEELIGFPIYWEPLAMNVPIRERGLTITPFPTSHLESLRKAFQKSHPASCFDAFSFILEGSGKRVAYTGDLGTTSDLDHLLERPLDLLLCELSHVPFHDLLRHLSGRDIGRIVFTHLERDLWADLDRVRGEIQAVLGRIPFVIAKDGDCFYF